MLRVQWLSEHLREKKFDHNEEEKKECSATDSEPSILWHEKNWIVGCLFGILFFLFESIDCSSQHGCSPDVVDCLVSWLSSSSSNRKWVLKTMNYSHYNPSAYGHILIEWNECRPKSSIKCMFCAHELSLYNWILWSFD